jgi:hypothetical protein
VGAIADRASRKRKVAFKEFETTAISKLGGQRPAFHNQPKSRRQQRVNRATLTVRRSLPIFPRQQT